MVKKYSKDIRKERNPQKTNRRIEEKIHNKKKKVFR